MVFESIVAELLNKVLGEYIQNLDYRQLKLSLWGGDVVLNDLLISEHALDVLDLPIKLEYGRLGKLILKIPFKDMWNGQIDAIIEELFILIIPSSQAKYDPEKEAKSELEAKRVELARIEKNKQLADAKLGDKLDDSMIEKLIARMIKNIHVEIKRIHVRYEDHVTFKDHPFSMGFTLDRLALESCDMSWLTTGDRTDMYAIPQIYKMCTIDSFSVYLNPNMIQFSNQLSPNYLSLFSETIATTNFIPDDYQYLLGPINTTAKLKLNPKPETDGSNYTIPKVWLDLEMQKLRIGLTKRQYQTLLYLGEGLDRATKAAPYRKYRPEVSGYRGYYKEWWRFAYKCVLEEEVRRVHRNWDWNHMKDHRDTCREYAKVYQMKLTAKKLTQEIENCLENCEKKLTIFDLVVIRQQIEMEVERLAEREKNLRAQRGWFGFLWGSSQADEVKDLNSAAAIMRKFEEEMTPAEKEKLFRAIDYQENTAPAHYPETYVMIDTAFFLHGLQIIISDTEKKCPDVLDLQLNGVKAAFKSRPAANAIFVSAAVNEIKTLGVKQNDIIPSLLKSSNERTNEDLFNVSYETNPIDKLCGDRIIVKSKSLQIVYDAQTIIELVKLFKVQNQSTLNQIQAAAAERLEGLKEMSALGLEYAIQKHSVLDIQVDLEASQLIVPYGGFLTNDESVIVINFGSLKVYSMEKIKDDLADHSVRQMVSMGKTEEDILIHLRKQSYDRFELKIVNFQALVAFKNDDWQSALMMAVNPMALLQPTTLEIQFHKCLVTDDPLLPKMRIIGQLPTLILNIPDARLLEALAIANSIPLPESDEPVMETNLTKSVSQLSLNYMKEITRQDGTRDQKANKSADTMPSTDIEAKFVMKELILTVSKHVDDRVEPFMRVEVLQVEAEMFQRTFEQEIMLRLGGIQMIQYHDTQEIFMINTPMTSGSQEYLIVVQSTTVNKRSPDFITRHGSVVQLLQLEFTTLDVLLHQEALINCLKFINDVQEKMSKTSAPVEQVPQPRSASTRLRKLSVIQEDTTAFIKDAIQKTKTKSEKYKRGVVECIDLKIQAKVGTITLKIASEEREISEFLIHELTAGYLMKISYSQANVNLTSINIKDLNPNSIHKNIVSVEGSESLQVQAVMYNIDPSEIDKNNMSIKVSMGCHRIVFLNVFVTSVMNFLNNFQAAQTAIAEASAAAAEVAKTNIKDVQESSARIELSVKIKAPVIFVPINSKSEHGLVLDMGNLTVHNTLKTIPIKNDKGDLPIIDEMMIELQNFKLSRVKLNDQGTFDINTEVRLLQPMNFGVLMKRNLSTAWYKGVPDIDVSGRLQQIEILISHEDYIMIMEVLERNFSETLGEQRKSQSVVRDERRKTGEIRASEEKHKVEIVKEEPVDDNSSQKQSHTAVKFEFIMDSLVINLFTGGSKMLQNKLSPVHLPENGLAKFELTYFAVKGKILADGVLATSILLMNCTLDDMRHDRRGQLTRIMERTTEIPSMEDLNKSESDKTVKSVRSMLDVTYRQTSSDMFVDVRVFSFSIIVSLDYLLKVQAFFMLESTQAQQNSTTVAVAAQKGRHSDVIKKKNPPQPVQTMMTINLHLERPDIILLEDMDDINSNCIVLNTELLLKMRMIGDHQVISGSVKDLSLSTGIYNPARRNDVLYQVLKPCSISIAGSTPEGKGLHVDVCCTDIHLSVSPGMIEIINRVVQKLTYKEEEKDETTKVEPTYEGLWLVTPFEESNYWFLKTEVAEEVFEDLSYSSTNESEVYKPELAIVSAPNISLTLEAGVGNKTLPMLFLHLGFHSDVNDWSRNNMSINATMSMIMAYYNSHLASWEPLIEPIESIKHNEKYSTPWELKMNIQFRDLSPNSEVDAISPISEAGEVDELINQPSRMSIDIQSSENLEITVTKTCLEVLKQLGDAFSSAMDLTNKPVTEKLAPYVLKNETGLMLALDLESSHFQVLTKSRESFETQSESYAEVVLDTGASIELAPTIEKPNINILEQLKNVSVDSQTDYKFYVKFHGIAAKLAIPVLKADKRFFSLKYRKEGSEEWGIISDVIVENGSTIVTLRSILQVHNHFTEAVSVYYMTKAGNEVECVGKVEPDQCLNLPLDAVYPPSNIYWLFFSVNGYMVSVEPLIWKDLQKTQSMAKVLKCEPRSKQSKEPFYIQTVGEIEQVYFEYTSRHTMASTLYNIHLYPSVYLKNFLPIDITVVLPGATEEKLVKASENIQLTTIDPDNSKIVIKLLQYLEKDWSCVGDITANSPEFSVWSFESFDSAQKVVMDLGLHCAIKNGSIVMALYCPFWMLNKTGLMLSYRGSEDYLNVIYHPENYKGPILFSFRSKAFFGKKKAMVRIEDGDWSEKFSIDVAGSKGDVVCRYRGMDYRIGVHNQLTYNSLTKQITFTPYFVLINNAHFLIECQEANRPASPLTRVKPGECSALWPESELERKTLIVMAGGYPEKTAAFVINEVHSTLLKIANKYGGIDVDIQINEGGVYISFSAYSPGLAPALIINHTSHIIDLWEKGSMNVRSIQSFNRMYYTWENPLGSRKLVWEDNNKREIENDLRKDVLEPFVLPDIGEEIYYVSFLDGLQRILLFTPNLKIAEDCQLVGDLEIVDQEIILSIHGVGLSLVNNVNHSELLYMCIASSGVIWETRKTVGSRWRALNTGEVIAIEEGYQKYLREIQISDEVSYRVMLEPKLLVDYQNMEMLRPHRRYMRRTFQTGLWMQYRTSAHQVHLHAKINRLQIDNQLSDCFFPVILAPVPPPKSITQSSVMRPFAEMSMVKRLLEHSTAQQFRYFKVLIQEFHIKVDIAFVNALVEFFEANEVNDVEESKLFQLDRKLVDEPLMYHVNLITTAEQKNFFDLLHFSPLKIHISFSLSGSGGGPSSLPQFLNVLVQGIGVTLTDINDIVFKLAFFERNYTFMTHNQLISEATSHYTNQAIKQLYVLVFGLDVIGNPYGLVMGTVQGIEDLFYEPFQGAIQGPGEFAEGLLLGVRSMLGHTVGGVAGAVSKITGAMGKGLAALTFDTDYQKKRQEQVNKQPVNLQEGLARSGKGLVMGVVDGVTGVVMKPISGAKEEGVEGFFKGVGKGMVGLVTRPTAGVIDFASGSFGAVRKATELSEEVKRVRPPRFLQADSLVKPYVHTEAEGHKILCELEKGKYANTDVYFYHLPIGKNMILLTDKRIAYLEYSDLFGGWKVDWAFTWNELAGPAEIVSTGVQISIKVAFRKKKLGGLFGSGDQIKVLSISDSTLRQKICNMIQTQLNQLEN